MKKDKPFDFQKRNHITGFKNDEKVNSWEQLRKQKELSKKASERQKAQREADAEEFRKKKNAQKKPKQMKNEDQQVKIVSYIFVVVMCLIAAAIQLLTGFKDY